MVSLTLLGGPNLETERGMVGGRAARGHCVALLAVLAIAGPRPVTRDKLIGLLWPEHDTDRARHALSQTLYLVRGAIADNAVVPVGDGLRLNPERVRSDVAEFEEALQAGDLRRVVELYRGPLLDGFFLSGSPEFEQWAGEARERLHRAWAGAAEALACELEAGGDATGAVEWWRRLADADPYSGRYALRLMLALQAAGDRVAAIRHADAHEERLRSELGVEVNPAVPALADRLRTETHDPEPRATGPTSPSSARSPASPTSPTSAVAPALPLRAVMAMPARSRRRAALAGAVAAGLLALAIATLMVPARLARDAWGGPTLAVLPFVNLGGDPAQTYFADGVHEDLLGQLSRIEALKVISRTSVLGYRDSGKNLRRIGRELGAEYVVEGSVRREGDRVLITAQLIDARSDHHLWADQYHGQLADVFALQARIAREIAAALQVRLTPEELRRAETPPTWSLTAYDLYLHASEHAGLFRPADLERAIELLRLAIETDGAFALAHARLATSIVVATELFARDRGRLHEALAASRRAVELDPGLAEAHHALGTVLLALGDFDGARHALEHAVALNSGLAPALANLAALHGRLGRHDEAVAWSRRAARLDPRGVMNLTGLAWNYAILGHFDHAEQVLHRAVILRPDSRMVRQNEALLALLRDEIDAAARIGDALAADHPGDAVAWTVAGHARLMAGDVEAARTRLERAHALSPTAAWITPASVLLGHTLIATGDEARGRTMLAEFVRRAAADPSMDPAAATDRWALAAAHAALAQRDDAVRWYRALVDQGAGVYRVRLDDPVLAALHGDAEFARIWRTGNERLDAMARRAER
jgi:TolB-like protein/DNA-binding SARP family transcriptional activator/Flp pilus assembly protein TadD